MALRGTLTHWKTRVLAQHLGMMQCQALGIVEALWHATAERAPAGNIGRLSNKAIALEMYYDGDPDELVAALIASVHLDQSEEHRLIVHDWATYADDATDNKLARLGSRYATGEMPRMKRLSKQEREQLSERFSVPCAQNATACHEKPLPVPVPVPEKEKALEPTAFQTKKPSGKKNLPADERTSSFREAIFEAWKRWHPNGTDFPWGPGEGKALKEFLKENPSLDLYKFKEWLKAREQSASANLAKPPRQWLGSLVKYACGPLNTFKQPLQPRKPPAPEPKSSVKTWDDLIRLKMDIPPSEPIPDDVRERFRDQHTKPPTWRTQ